mmetsp:Transcript_1634/g.3447  ORF Transcript_1634/g.3447 Transcript_1634/m.3447 type:complete len:227 (-) Transcript_1634:1353-2033(-)
MLGVFKIIQNLVPEAGIQQVKNRMFCSANVQVNRHPLLVHLLTECGVAILWIHESKVVPTTSSPLGHCVRFTCKPFAILLEVSPVLGPSQATCWIVTWSKIFHMREFERQVGFVHWNCLIETDSVFAVVAGWILRRRVNTFWKVNWEIDWNWFTPVSLTRENPIPKFVRDLRSSFFHLLQFVCNRLLAVLGRLAIEFTTVHCYTTFSESFLLVEFALLWLNNPFDV